MKLANLARQVAKAAPELLREQMIYDFLDFRGPCNAHLAIPASHDPEKFNWEKNRHESLTGDEEIGGDVLVLNYDAHYKGTMVLHECSSLAEAAKLVLGDVGVFNPFTSLVLVFDRFQLRPFRVTYQDGAGGRAVFDPSTAFAPTATTHEFPRREIEWLEMTGP